MSSVIRLGTVAKDSQYRSTIALPIRSTARTSGRFSNRDIVDCEHNCRSMGERSSAILNIGSRRSALASLPSSQPAQIISSRKRMTSAKLCVI
jgi:hypothetical protein